MSVNLRLKVMIAAASLLSAVMFFGFITHNLVTDELHEQQHLVDITNAFTRAYTEQRSANTAVPATFRRIGMEHFAHQSGALADSDRAVATMRMPGTPGLEIRTIEQIERVRDYIDSLAQSGQRETKSEFRLEEGRLLARTIVPSIASDQSCVVCHNTYVGQDTYALGDVMGAFVVETDLGPQVAQKALIAFCGLLILMLGGMHVARREQARMQSVVEALTGQLAAESQAKFNAEHDALTGLANRKLFSERLKADVKRAACNPDLDASLFIIDLDDFKGVNDSLGHDAGDALLIAAAERLKTVFDAHSGFVARLGGDEFAAVVCATDGAGDPQALGREILHTVCKPIFHMGSTIEPRVSVGIASLSALSATSGKKDRHLLKAADVALYAAKRRGKQCFRVFDDKLLHDMERRTNLAEALLPAIQSGDVRAILQPQVDLETRRVVGFEALARWRHKGEEIPPLEFIAIAEETGLVSQLDMAVLGRAIELVKNLGGVSDRNFTLSVNVSTHDLRKPDFAEAILDTLLLYGFPADALVLEITESAFLADWTVVRQRLDSLQEHGVRIALDDFGTGYSSLSYLTQFSFDIIKVDRSFVMALGQEPSHRHLLSNIIELAKTLRKTVTVEGIETEKQAALVRHFGANTAQGALFGLDMEDVQLDDGDARIQGSADAA